ncbi:hypothetical protein [Actinomycetospora chiangmaiensis]|uniref:hypothetical protein n=1 Tax=Actinomycetospora chiangmaiensis TaxID=402650 RepID=UPI0003A7FC8B|nr:hypothetical protein [Actinomycetospora chiangmaiensis]
MSTTSRREHGDDFVPTEEIIRRRGAKPLRSADELAREDAFSSDEEYENFLRDLYASRRRS